MLGEPNTRETMLQNRSGQMSTAQQQRSRAEGWRMLAGIVILTFTAIVLVIPTAILVDRQGAMVLWCIVPAYLVIYPGGVRYMLLTADRHFKDAIGGQLTVLTGAVKVYTERQKSVKRQTRLAVTTTTSTYKLELDGETFNVPRQVAERLEDGDTVRLYVSARGRLVMNLEAIATADPDRALPLFDDVEIAQEKLRDVTVERQWIERHGEGSTGIEMGGGGDDFDIDFD